MKITLFDANQPVLANFYLNNNPLNEICHVETNHIRVIAQQNWLKSDYSSIILDSETVLDLIAEA